MAKSRATPKAKSTPRSSVLPSPCSYNTPVTPMDLDDNDLSSMYGGDTTPTPVCQSKRKHTTTPSDNSSKRSSNSFQQPRTLFSPPSQSLKDSVPSEKFGARKNAGQVIASFGTDKSVQWKNEDEKSVTISLYDEASGLREKYAHVYESREEKVGLLTSMIEEMEPTLKSLHKIDIFSPVSGVYPEDVYIMGRICYKDGSDPLSTLSLEGCNKISNFRRVRLDLSHLQEYAFYPGQIVALHGNNRNGDSFKILKVLSCVPPSLPQHTLSLPKEDGPIQFVACCGPYTMKDNLLYEPLADVLKYVKENKPHVFIIMGPFIDSRHEEIKKGLLEETYETMFNNWINYIASCLSEFPIQIVVVPSFRDIHHDYTYPVPPFNLQQRWQNLHLVSEPSLLKVNGVVIGLSSTDVISDLSKEEMYLSSGSDRMARLVKHILTQARFYPLHPPKEGIPLNFVKSESFATLPVIPHILLLPSKLRSFIKEVDDCVVINPEHLSKEIIGGSFARFQILPQENNGSDTLNREQIVAEVLKI